MGSEQKPVVVNGKQEQPTKKVNLETRISVREIRNIIQKKQQECLHGRK